jgi:trans-aconitate 2-methyltransferase
MPPARDWDAATYDRIADPQARWGLDVLARLPLEGDEAVLDAGCGSGRVTEALAERLPRGRVIAVDASPAMLVEARRRLVRFGDRVSFVVADLGLPLPQETGRDLDAILSTATFHWITDHDALFRNLAAVLRPGGRLVAQCGGEGNVASIRAVLAGMGEPWPAETRFENPAATRRRLEAAGFTAIETWLNPEPTRFERGELFETFLRTVILRLNVGERTEAQEAAFVHEVATRLDEPVVDYVRLNILATKA